MKTTENYPTRIGMILTLIGCMFLLAVPFAVAQEDTTGMSIDGAQYTKGTIKQVSKSRQRIVIKPEKGERIKIYIDGQTSFVKMNSFDEFKRGQQLKIWYTADGDKNKAVKIEKLPDVGC